MAGISTGVSLLSVSEIPLTVELKTGLLGYWDFENTLNSYDGSNPYFFNGNISVGEDIPLNDINPSNSGEQKVGTSCVRTQPVKTGAFYAGSIIPPVTLNNTSGTFAGWIKTADGDGVVGTKSYALAFPYLSTTGNYNTPNMGIAFSGLGAGSSNPQSITFAGSGTTVTTIPHGFSVWKYVCYWYDFNDKSQGVNGSEYFQINNGTVYGRQTPSPPASQLTIERAPSIATSAAAPNYYFAAYADCIGVWDRVLNSAERSSLYNSGSGKNYSQL